MRWKTLAAAAAVAVCSTHAHARITRIVIDARNRLIQDIELARDKDGKVRYVATFVLTKRERTAAASAALIRACPRAG